MPGMKSITEMLMPAAFSVKLDFQPAKILIDSISIKNDKSINSANNVPVGNGNTVNYKKYSNTCIFRNKKRYTRYTNQ